jgi:hypothetical protein
LIVTPPPAARPKLHPRLRSRELRRALLVGLAGLMLGGTSGTIAVMQVWGAVHVSPRDLASASALLLLALAFFVGAAREARLAFRRLALASEIEQDGMLSSVRLLETKRDELGFRVMLRYRYRTPGGTELQAAIALSEGGAYRLNGSDDESLALLSRDGQRGLLLTRSGYPLLNALDLLAQRPAQTSLGRHLI